MLKKICAPTPKHRFVFVRLPVIALKTLLLTGLSAGILAGVSAGILAGCQGTLFETRSDEPPPSVTVSGLLPVTPEPPGEQLRPGLSVLYFDKFFERHIDKLPVGKEALKRGKPGKPIPYLNHRFGESNVFDSRNNRGIGMQMTGLLRFDQPGDYVFRVKSNDGFRMFVGDRMILDDPTMHGDRFSAPGTVQMDIAGWYRLMIQYFQRKGTATVELYWQPPGAADFSVVPAEAYAHLPM